MTLKVEHWHRTVDVAVIGYGFAGAAAAIEAFDQGADVLLVEKNSTPGGIRFVPRVVYE
ncbi:MAG: FAD-dependent oxidoreductase [Burkholderiaceae bacterium]